MITFSKVKESIINSFRSIKVLQFGAKTADVVAPFGDDSSPLENMTAIYAETTNVGESIVIGYINNNQIALPGEKRIFSLDASGNLSTYIHLKTDGTMEVGGNDDNAVRYSTLASGLVANDALVNAELAKIATAITTLGGVYIPSPVSTDITLAKINEVKVSKVTLVGD